MPVFLSALLCIRPSVGSPVVHVRVRADGSRRGLCSMQKKSCKKEEEKEPVCCPVANEENGRHSDADERRRVKPLGVMLVDYNEKSGFLNSIRNSQSPRNLTLLATALQTVPQKVFQPSLLVSGNL